MFDTEGAAPRIAELDSNTMHDWDEFVEHCPEATFFHRAGWRRILETSLGHETHYLYAASAGTIVGVLPLVHLRSRLFGRSLISTAFCVYGGPAANSAAAREGLTARAVELADRLDVDYLEYRSCAPKQPDWPRRSTLYATFRKSLDPDAEKNMLAIPRKRRAMVRKGMSFGLVSEIDPDIDRLYRVYSESVWHLGTPVFPKRYFAALREEFGPHSEVLTVTHQGRPVSSVMSFFFREEVLPYYGGGVAEARPLAANDFMYWEVMRRAAARGCKIFDFGRSKYTTGSFDFKRFWGFEPQPLHYEYKLRRGGDLPDFNPLNPKYRLLIGLWKRLPFPVATFFGPLVARSLG